jgi:AmmeMemoRadiSam system protein B
MTMLRKTAHAGTFYPRFADQITSLLQKWIDEDPAANETERCLGLLLPHAGYIYSGKCATWGMASIAHENVDSFIILHPSHQGMHFDFSLSPYLEYETPLGNLALDADLYKALSPCAQQNIALDYHALEHSMEIQLPLIRYFFPDAKICPVMIGNQIPAVASDLAATLYDLVYKSARRIMILVSSDLSHYHPAKRAEEMDQRVARHFLALDAGALWKDDQHGLLEACGIGGIMTLLMMAQRYTSPTARVIHYTHSGESSGNNSQVVGYLAAKVNL